MLYLQKDVMRLLRKEITGEEIEPEPEPEPEKMEEDAKESETEKEAEKDEEKKEEEEKKTEEDKAEEEKDAEEKKDEEKGMFHCTVIFSLFHPVRNACGDLTARKKRNQSGQGTSLPPSPCTMQWGVAYPWRGGA